MASALFDLTPTEEQRMMRESLQRFAASEMTPEARRAMVEGMVASLGARLADEGGSAQEWAQLIVGRAVLGDRAGASAVLAEARSVFASDPEALAMFDQAEAQIQNIPEVNE